MENTKANYDKVSKEIIKALTKREKAKAAIENEIASEAAQLQKLEQEKERLLIEGLKEEYLKTAAAASTAENTLIFLKGRKGIVLNENKLDYAFMDKCKNTIREEQDRITKNALNSIKEKYEEILNICNDVMKDQEAGSALLQDLYRAFKEDSPADTKYGVDNGENYYKYSCLFGINYIPAIRRETERSLVNFQKYDGFLKGEKTN